jgi:AcrR family transcriptional regulator
MVSEVDDKESAKSKILDTAKELFAEKGFDGARVDEIARRAGVNKALIYYYYKNKQALLDALIEQVKNGVFQTAHNCG